MSARLAGSNALGLPFYRIAGFLGRSDNMVKFKGINFYPGGGWRRAGRTGGVPPATMCACARANSSTSRLKRETPACPAWPPRITALIRERLGVAVPVTLRGPGALGELTGSDSRQKPRRLITG